MKNKQRGFTLIEMVMVIIIMGIIITLLSPLLMQSLNIFIAGENIVNANWQGQLAMARITRDISSIRSPIDITTIDANNLAFTDIDSNTISYTLDGNNLTLTYNGTPAVLANGIQSLAFTYYDRNGGNTAVPSAVRFIQVSINVTQHGVNYTLTNMIYPRNLL